MCGGANGDCGPNWALESGPKLRPDNVSDALATWLLKAGLGDRIRDFRSAQIDLEQLPNLTNHQLEQLGLSPDEQVRFNLAAAGIRELPATNPVPELRPITATYIDLVDSTAISMRLDHDDFLETLRQYYEACSVAISRYGGHILQLHGDGILSVFSLPSAHDDDPERGVRAALDAVAAVSRGRAADGAPIAARAGVATGRVLVGARFGRPLNAAVSEFGEALGSTLHLAARLQTMAPPVAS